MVEKDMYMFNNKCGEAIVLASERKPGQLTDWSIVNPSCAPQKTLVINKQLDLSDE